MQESEHSKIHDARIGSGLHTSEYKTTKTGHGGDEAMEVSSSHQSALTKLSWAPDMISILSVSHMFCVLELTLWLSKGM